MAVAALVVVVVVVGLERKYTCGIRKCHVRFGLKWAKLLLDLSTEGHLVPAVPEVHFIYTTISSIFLNYFFIPCL
jgi:hypothetical protein